MRFSAPQLSSAAGPDTAPAAHVLVIAADRRFRMFAATSLAQRGYHVTVSSGTQDVAEVIACQQVEVAVIDATASLTAAAHEVARLQSASPGLGVVVVSDSCQHQGLSAFPVLPRWSSCHLLCAAIEQARNGGRSAGTGPARR